MDIDTKKPGYFSRSEAGNGARTFYLEHGYLVVCDALTCGEIEALRRETTAICRREQVQLEKSPPGATGSETHSAVIGRAQISDDEMMRHFLCIHHPHKTSPIIRDFLAHPAIVEVLTSIVGQNVKCMQTMLFVKAAGKPGQAWHQDESFIPTRDRSLTGAWIALDDAVINNGCLWVLPGSHRPGVLWPMYPHDDPRYDCTGMSYDFPYHSSDAIAVEVPAGAVVFFNGYLLHKSEPNIFETGFRRALVNHYMSAESLLPWFVAQEGRSFAQSDYRDITMVSGKDPYAWKGVEDLAKPHVRPAGEGGCGDGRLNLAAHKERLDQGVET